MLSATSHRNLFREHYVGILRRKHPFVGRKLTLKTMETLDHVVITSPFAGHHVIEWRLREACLSRKPRLAIQSFAGVPEVVAHTNLLAIAPSRVAKAYERSHGLRTVALPVGTRRRSRGTRSRRAVNPPIPTISGINWRVEPQKLGRRGPMC